MPNSDNYPKQNRKLFFVTYVGSLVAGVVITLLFGILDFTTNGLHVTGNGQYSRILVWGTLFVSWILVALKCYLQPLDRKYNKRINFTLSVSFAATILAIISVWLYPKIDSLQEISILYMLPAIVLQCVVGYDFIKMKHAAVHTIKPIGLFIVIFTLLYLILAIIVYAGEREAKKNTKTESANERVETCSFDRSEVILLCFAKDE